MGILGSILKGVITFAAGSFLVAGGGAVIAGGAVALGTYAVAKAAAGALSSKSSQPKSYDSNSYKTLQAPTRPVDPKKTFSQIRETNNELEEFRRQSQRDKFLSPNDSERVAKLEDKIDFLYQEYEMFKHQRAIESAQKSPNEYENFSITSERLHILQYHVGETVIGKKCYDCDRPMILQFKRDKMIISMDDLFWACTGWYYDECNITQRFDMADMKLLAKTDKEEFHITSQQLASILQNKNMQDYTSQRMRTHRGERVDDYVCPIHKEPLVLRQKKAGKGILDNFFLGCPRWNPQNGCTYVLKLKSPAQLASFLHKTEEKGIL